MSAARSEIHDGTFAVGSSNQTALEVARPQGITGAIALANLSDEEFERNLAAFKKGQERVRRIQQEMMRKDLDYGQIPGTPKPTLYKPGAETLGLTFGIAARFEAERIVGDGEKAPPLTYHVRCYGHLRDFDGPIVAQGFGEANSWETRYRYRTQRHRRTCPDCGAAGLIKGKETSKLQGKWWCPPDKGGCGHVFPSGDRRITSQEVGDERTENPDPYDLANTLLKMGEKRSHVDMMLRATGTSGLFTQDIEDLVSEEAPQASVEAPDARAGQKPTQEPEQVLETPGPLVGTVVEPLPKEGPGAVVHVKIGRTKYKATLEGDLGWSAKSIWGGEEKISLDGTIRGKAIENITRVWVLREGAWRQIAPQEGGEQPADQTDASAETEPSPGGEGSAIQAAQASFPDADVGWVSGADGENDTLTCTIRTIRWDKNSKGVELAIIEAIDNVERFRIAMERDLARHHLVDRNGAWLYAIGEKITVSGKWWHGWLLGEAVSSG
jgi:hypothetical protein